jgi:murein DD-endopeptidase MepM/ murein hydrolase activator NlpD
MSYVFPILGSGWRWGGGVDEHHKRPLGNWQSDNAVDIMAPAGSVNVAPVSGRVVRVSGRDPRQGPSGTIFGRSITIQEPGGRQWFVTHLDNPVVREGQFVQAGSPLARVADWGERSHAHWAVSQGDPRALLQGGTPAAASVIPAASTTATGAGCLVHLLYQLTGVFMAGYLLVEVLT